MSLIELLKEFESLGELIAEWSPDSIETMAKDVDTISTSVAELHQIVNTIGNENERQCAIIVYNLCFILLAAQIQVVAARVVIKKEFGDLERAPTLSPGNVFEMFQNMVSESSKNKERYEQFRSGIKCEGSIDRAECGKDIKCKGCKLSPPSPIIYKFA